MPKLACATYIST